MTIEKLTEFAKTGQKDTDQLDLETGFIVNRKPARQWFNWLFNILTLKINELIDADYVQKSNIIDNLTTDDATKPVSAKQAKILNDEKLGKNENSATATKLQTARTIGGVSFDGTANINLPGVNTSGNQNTSGNAATATTARACSGNAATATKLATSRTINGVGFDGTANINLPLLGYSQTYQVVTSSRAFNVEYTNSSGKPIVVSITKRDSYGEQHNEMNLLVNGIKVASVGSNTGYNIRTSMTVIVPVGAKYKLTGADLGFTHWAELR